MDTIFDRLTQGLNEDELRHITPLKMLGLYREHLLIVPVVAGNEQAFLMRLPRVASQWATVKYSQASLIILPVLSGAPSAAMIAACVVAILEIAGTEVFLVNSSELGLIAAMRVALPTLTYQRALLTFTPDGARGADGVGFAKPADVNSAVQLTDHIPLEARALLAAHDVYSASELDTMFAEGSARCLLRFEGRDAVAMALSFPNTPTLHEIGSLYVAPHARRAGHARVLVRTALADMAARSLAVRYVADATNAPSIELATRCGLREVMRLEHWLSA